MSVYMSELASSRKSDLDLQSGSVTLEFILLGTTDEVVAGNTLLAGTTKRWDFLQRQKVSVEPLGGGCWKGTVEYGITKGESVNPAGGGNPSPEPGKDDPLTGEFSFDTSGGTRHVTQSLATTTRKGSGTDVAPDFKGAIGVSKNGVAGTDIIVPKLEFQITKLIDTITLGYIGILVSVTGKVNSKPFLTAQKGELLFMGASGKSQLGKPASLTFKFSWSKNRTDVKITDDLKNISVLGWEHIWVGYGDELDTLATKNAIVSRPNAAYVEQVYEFADFRVLGIF